MSLRRVLGLVDPMPLDLAGPALGLASAASWGAGDFCGGLAAKRSPLAGVLVVGAAAGAALVAAAALLLGEPAPPAVALGWGVAAGAAGAVGLAALYRGLAVGRMATVAPVSAVLCATVPVAWGALAEGVPPAAKLAGFALALAGIWLVARSGSAGAGGAGLGLGVVAGCSFGGFLVLLHLAGGHGGSFWPLAAARATSCALVLAAALARRQRWAPARGALPLLALCGALDAGGNVLFLLASRLGRLDVAAVLSSMYPASTILLAAALLGERVSRPQGAGIAALLGAIALIAG